MNASKRATPVNSPPGSDLAKVDTHEITPEEYDELPELDDEWFAQAEIRVGGVLVRRGRPKSAAPKRQVTLRLDPDVIHHFKAGGPGWQSRINAALRAALGEKKAG